MARSYASTVQTERGTFLRVRVRVYVRVRVRLRVS